MEYNLIDPKVSFAYNFIYNSSNITPHKLAYYKRCIINLLEYSYLENINDKNIIFCAKTEKEKENAFNIILYILNQWYYKISIENFRYFTNREKCQLCQNFDNLRQYRIVNKINNNFLWVGSTCIINFSIDFYNKNNEIINNNNEKRNLFIKYSTKISEKERIKEVINFIEFINTKIPEKDQIRLYKYNKEKGIFYIRQIKYIAFVYKKYNIDDTINDGFIPDEIIKLFKVNMRIKENKKELKEKFRPFHWLQFITILDQKYYSPEYGYSYNDYINAKDILETKKNYSDKEKNWILNKLSYYYKNYNNNLKDKTKDNYIISYLKIDKNDNYERLECYLRMPNKTKSQAFNAFFKSDLVKKLEKRGYLIRDVHIRDNPEYKK